MAKKKISKSELKLKEIENQSHKMKIQETIKAINKLADKYPSNVLNSNQKIWRPWK